MSLLTSSRSRSSRSRTIRVGAVVCIVLFALLSLMLIPHVHQTPSDAEHCALCITMHTVVGVTIAIAAIVLVRLGIARAFVQTAEYVRYWHPQLFIRPPPQTQ